MSHPAPTLQEVISDYLDIPIPELEGMNPADVAELLIGVEEATGNNDGLPDRLFNRSAGDGAAWCADFVMAMFAAVGRPIHTSVREWWLCRSARALEQLLFSRGEWAGPAYRPARGDVVVFYRDAGSGRHVGLVKDTTEAGDILTIEGNISDAVVSRSFHRHNPVIAGYCRPGGWW